VLEPNRGLDAELALEHGAERLGRLLARGARRAERHERRTPAAFRQAALELRAIAYQRAHGARVARLGRRIHRGRTRQLIEHERLSAHLTRTKLNSASCGCRLR